MLREALVSVVHFPISVVEGEGVALSELYRVGFSYPVFILTDSAGAVITRWTGYTGADRFVRQFRRAMADLTTVEARIADQTANPNVTGALALAKYHSDIHDYPTAREYYRRAQSLRTGGADFSFQFFRMTAEAVWADQLPFDSLVVAADAVLEVTPTSHNNRIRLAQIIGNVARRTGHTDRLAKYLDAGLRASATKSDDDGRKEHLDLRVDHALHVAGDTVKAVEMKQAMLGDGWQDDPARYYQYGDWCFQRRIRLGEAEDYVRRATAKASDGPFKAKHLRLLAEICYYRGNLEEAIQWAEQALEMDPSIAYFEERLALFRSSADGSK